MDIRKNAVDLSTDERDAFLEAVIRLKHKPAEGLSNFSVYDQFVALHGAVMAVLNPHSPDPINFAHGNIGFLPWHRQYLRAFELALQEEVAGVTLPYWDWSDDVGAANELFTADFLSNTTWGRPTPVTDGVLREHIPANQRPGWWPAGANGFRVNQLLEEGFGNNLMRGSMESSWPPSSTDMSNLETLNIPVRGSNPLWAFWLVLEQGHRNVLAATHNAGHRFIGGHMGGANSPNDPVFWMHHANVDRVWANWQDYQLSQNASSTYVDYWPSETEDSPFSGSPAPQGHKLNDPMWPWVGNEAGYQSASVSQAIRNRLYDYSQDPVVTVKDMLDFRAMGFEYQ